ncbi:FAD binding domain family protein [Candida albicans]|uniref:FAD binding domain family protein n=1 Tax=Candida albicans TaxID=5476 RepID=A0A8H6BS38_CANAX|nr:FAD binding domain family protein [Candida albicans]
MSKILSSIPGNMSKSIAKYDTIVIGSGLAGLTTTYQLSKAGQKVALLEKSEKLGGNSIKASSGINGVPTKYQKQPSTDSIESFVQDTLKTGKNLNDKKMVDILTKNSRDAIYWLNDEINVDLSNVVLLGGHSHARTHKGDKLPPGFAIVSALTKKLDGFQAENPDQLTILKSSTLTKILTEGNKVKGIEFTDSEKQPQEMYADNVVLATGGFSADFDSPTSLLQKYRPDLLGFPSSNGAQTTGDGQKIAERDVNAELIHMDKVQVHPTGFMKVSNPNENWKFLCGELMRGIGDRSKQ